MEESIIFNVTVKYTDGTSEIFEFSSAEQKLNLEKMLSSPVLTLDLNETLLVVPTQHIKSLEVSPVPKELPGDIIRNAKRIQKKTLL